MTLRDEFCFALAISIYRLFASMRAHPGRKPNSFLNCRLRLSSGGAR
jgi:hypothetical protein